jgi:hypothetical protein
MFSLEYYKWLWNYSKTRAKLKYFSMKQTCFYHEGLRASHHVETRENTGNFSDIGKQAF